MQHTTGKKPQVTGQSNKRHTEQNVKNRSLRTFRFIQKKELLRRFAAKAQAKKSAIRLRRLEGTDRQEIRKILENSKVFRDEEIGVAISLVDEFLHGSPDYRFLVAAGEDDSVLGYICYGHAPMTSGTWDIYWIAVSRDFQRRRIGSLLLECSEKEIRGEGGRLIIIETSGKPSYRSTRKFYEKMGYRMGARIAKFYSESDDKLIYCKYFAF